MPIGDARSIISIMKSKVHKLANAVRQNVIRVHRLYPECIFKIHSRSNMFVCFFSQKNCKVRKPPPFSNSNCGNCDLSEFQSVVDRVGKRHPQPGIGFHGAFDGQTGVIVTRPAPGRFQSARDYFHFIPQCFGQTGILAISDVVSPLSRRLSDSIDPK